MNLTIASRDSTLAVIQSQMAMAALKKADPALNLELVTMKTTGDLILDKTLDKIGGKGLFVKELDKALLEHRVDLTVHSYKDMPMEISPALPVVAVLEREDPCDVLICRAGFSGEIRRIGCSSLRRTIQLQALYPQAELLPVRGNVQTRLKKLDDGQFDALVLAFAGIKRLGLQQRISRKFTTAEIMPAACQGIIAIQARADFHCDTLKAINHKNSWLASVAERSFVRTLGGGCSSPIAAYARIQGSTICLEGMYVNDSGIIYKGSITGPADQGEALGRTLAKRLKKEAEQA